MKRFAVMLVALVMVCAESFASREVERSLPPSISVEFEAGPLGVWPAELVVDCEIPSDGEPQSCEFELTNVAPRSARMSVVLVNVDVRPTSDFELVDLELDYPNQTARWVQTGEGSTGRLALHGGFSPANWALASGAMSLFEPVPGVVLRHPLVSGYRMEGRWALNVEGPVVVPVARTKDYSLERHGRWVRIEERFRFSRGGPLIGVSLGQRGIGLRAGYEVGVQSLTAGGAVQIADRELHVVPEIGLSTPAPPIIPVTLSSKLFVEVPVSSRGRWSGGLALGVGFVSLTGDVTFAVRAGDPGPQIGGRVQLGL